MIPVLLIVAADAGVELLFDEHAGEFEILWPDGYGGRNRTRTMLGVTGRLTIGRMLLAQADAALLDEFLVRLRADRLSGARSDDPKEGGSSEGGER